MRLFIKIMEEEDGSIEWDALATAPDLALYIRERVPRTAWSNPLLLESAIVANNVAAVCLLLPHADLSAVFEGHDGLFDTFADCAWEHANSLIYEAICRACAHWLPAVPRFSDGCDTKAKAKIYAFYSTTQPLPASNPPEEVWEAWQCRARCRAAVIAFIGLKRFRLRAQMACLDRWLMREVAFEVWRTRVDEAWSVQTNEVDWRALDAAARRGRLYPYVFRNVKRRGWWSADSRGWAVPHYAAHYGCMDTFAHLWSIGCLVLDQGNVSAIVDVMIAAIKSGKDQVLAGLSPLIRKLDRAKITLIMDWAISVAKSSEGCLQVLLSKGITLDYASFRWQAHIPPHLKARKRR